MSEENIRYIAGILTDISDPLTRGSFWLNSWESMIEKSIAPEEFLKLLIAQIPYEDNILIINRLRGHLSDIFWNYFNSEERERYYPILEEFTYKSLINEPDNSEKLSWFNTYMSVAYSLESLENIYSFWRSEKEIAGLIFSESDYISMSMNLALKRYVNSDIILQEQLERIDNSDRKAEFKYIIQAVDTSEYNRDIFFYSLRDEKNRQHEPWVIKALGYLHHPLNSESSSKYIPESLNLLKEIQETGDIFFPGQWISTTLAGHNSKEVFDMVSIFLNENPGFPPSLKLKVLQAYDHLFRKYGKEITK
jgi:aminopeptidase N